MNDDEQRDILDRTRRNPAYRDTPLGRSGDTATASSPLFHRRGPRPVRIGDRPWLWRVLGIPPPRSLVRVLIVDGYPRTLHRWAFGRVAAAGNWTCLAFGLAIAAGTIWFLDAAGFSIRIVLLAVVGLFLAAIGVAAICYLPILQALRYASQWRAGSRPAAGGRDDWSIR